MWRSLAGWLAGWPNLDIIRDVLLSLKKKIIIHYVFYSIQPNYPCFFFLLLLARTFFAVYFWIYHRVVIFHGVCDDVRSHHENWPPIHLDVMWISRCVGSKTEHSHDLFDELSTFAKHKVIESHWTKKKIILMRQKEFQGFKTIGRDFNVYGIHAYISKGHLSFGWTQKENHVTLLEGKQKKNY